MHSTGTGVLLRQLHQLSAVPGTARPSDQELLARFAAQRDEAAFTALVRRHGPMVLSVCRRALGNWDDAEDAFQATFLVLAAKAASEPWQESVAGWLHGVACRVARKARDAAARRRLREDCAPVRPAADLLAEINGRELRAVLDEELHRLPEKYRAPLVLCYLEGATRDEAARQLGWPLGTLKSRVERGRELLRRRLQRRGLALAVALSASALAADSAPAAGLVRGTTDAALLTAARGAPAGPVSAHALHLARGALHVMTLPRLQISIALMVAGGLVTAAVGLNARSTPTAPAGPPAPAAAEAPPARPAGRDLLNDPLPAGAVARLGTLRFRHAANINGVAFSRDGKALATSSLDNTLRVWDTATGKELRRFGDMNAEKFVAQLFCVAFSPDGKTVAAAGNGGRIFLYDRLTGAELHQLAGFDQPIQALALSPDGKLLASAGWDHHIRLWDVAGGTELRRLEGHTEHVQAVAFSPDGKRLASGSADRSVRLWDPATGQEVRRLDGLKKPVVCVAFAPDGRRVAGGAEGAALLWDVATGKEVRRFRDGPGDEWVRGLAFSPDGRALAAGCGVYGADWDHIHGRALLWDVETGAVLRRFTRGHGVFEAVAFAPEGKAVAAVGGHDSTVHLWEPATGKELDPAAGHRGPVTRVAFTADGRALLTSGYDETVRCWDGAGRVRWQVPGQAAWAGDDGQALTFVTGAAGVFLQTRDVERGTAGRRLLLHPGDRTAALSPDRRALASAGSDGTIRLWDVAAGTELRRLTGHDGRVRLLAFGPEGKVLASAGRDNTVRLWDAAGGKELRRFASNGQDLAFSPDGRLFAWVGIDPAALPRWGLHVYETATGKEVPGLTTPADPEKLPEARRGVMAATFSPDGRVLATGTGSEVYLWEVATGRERCRLQGHEGGVEALAFAPDGNRLASASSDTTVLVWDLRGGPPAAGPLSEETLKALGSDLADPDAAKAYRAMQALASAPGQGAPLLKRLLQPVPRVEADRLPRLLADLDSERFETRAEAAAELEKAGEAAELALRQALEKNPPVEVRRRLERLLDGLDARAASGDRLRALRAVEVLERIGTPEARAVLRQVADGAAQARLTEAARGALERLARHPATAP
jgi:RNA polymerase sigma factor (sigma-70 family)